MNLPLPAGAYTDPDLVVSEVFGPTIQGEGPTLGRTAAFLRVGGCHLACSWCDTAYTWDWRGTSDMADEQGAPFDPGVELERVTPAAAAKRTLDCLPDGGILVVSGGEPLNQQPALAATLRYVREQRARLEVEVETSGSRRVTPRFDAQVERYNVSLKLAHSGNDFDAAIVPAAIRALADTGKAAWKFVVATVGQLAEVESLVDRHDLAPVWIMPEGRDPDTVTDATRRIADATVAYGWNLTTRLHLYAWGGERGR